MKRFQRVLHSSGINAAWNAEVAFVEGFIDGKGRGIDKGILNTVVALRLAGFETVASYEGHLGRGMSAPWVDIQYGSSDAIERAFDGPLDPSRKTMLRDESQRQQVILKEQLDSLLDGFYQSHRVSSRFRLLLISTPSNKDNQLAIGFRLGSLAMFDTMGRVLSPPSLVVRMAEKYPDIRPAVRIAEEINGFDRLPSLLTARREMDAFANYVVEQCVVPLLTSGQQQSGLPQKGPDFSW